MALNSDPEVIRLTQAARTLMSQAYRLSRSIDETVDELRDFSDEVSEHRREARTGYEGVERRRGPRS